MYIQNLPDATGGSPNEVLKEQLILKRGLVTDVTVYIGLKIAGIKDLAVGECSADIAGQRTLPYPLVNFLQIGGARRLFSFSKRQG